MELAIIFGDEIKTTILPAGDLLHRLYQRVGIAGTGSTHATDGQNHRYNNRKLVGAYDLCRAGVCTARCCGNGHHLQTGKVPADGPPHNTHGYLMNEAGS